MAFRTLDGVDGRGQARAAARRPQRAGARRQDHRPDPHRAAVADDPRTRPTRARGSSCCSHFDRPKGKRVPEMSLAPMATALGEVLGRHGALRRGLRRPCRRSRRSTACSDGDVAGAGEHALPRRARRENDPAFAAALAKLGDIFVNDAFSRRASRACQHRGRRASAAGLCRAADAGGAGGAGRRARQSEAAGGGDRRRRQGLHQARAARQSGRQGRSC